MFVMGVRVHDDDVFRRLRGLCQFDRPLDGTEEDE